MIFNDMVKFQDIDVPSCASCVLELSVLDTPMKDELILMLSSRVGLPSDRPLLCRMVIT